MLVFHRLRALNEAGARVVLHCFQYGGRKPQPELEAYCEAVYYYPRRRALWQQFSAEPFIVRTRKHPALLRRLLQDEGPILFEGLHTAGWIGHPALRSRRKVLLMHNIEWRYYAHLGRSAASWWQRLFFQVESWRLRRAEEHLVPFADVVVALSPVERDYFGCYPANAYYLPPFHPYNGVSSQPGRGAYALFHGKWSVPDNERAALWLLEGVFAHLEVPFVLAGMAPTHRLRSAAARLPHVSLIADPDDAQMDALIEQAQVHVLYSFQSAGVKMKLLNALFRGRHCVANEHVVAGTALHSLCTVANDADSVRRAVQVLMEEPFEESHIAQRRSLLETHYANLHNARQLMAIAAGVGEPSGVRRV